jgi:hypothetical protein
VEERVSGGRDDRDETLRPPAPAEVEEAARLAAALEDGSPADGETLAAARFLQAVGRADADDEVAARRLRRSLVARASSRRVFLRAAAAAAAVLVLALGAARLRRHEDASNLLAAREAAAERAVAGIVSLRGDSLDAGVAVFDALLRERASASSPSAGSSVAPAASPAFTPTAGGPT